MEEENWPLKVISDLYKYATVCTIPVLKCACRYVTTGTYVTVRGQLFRSQFSASTLPLVSDIVPCNPRKLTQELSNWKKKRLICIYVFVSLWDCNVSPECGYSQRPEQGVRSLGAGVRSSWASYGSYELNLGPSENYQGLYTCVYMHSKASSSLGAISQRRSILFSSLIAIYLFDVCVPILECAMVQVWRLEDNFLRWCSSTK